jgi:GT2 family glycosyltransferase
VNPKLSVILVNYNGEEYLKSCFASIEHFLHNIPHEICVVDNASKDESLAFLRDEYPHVQIIENPENLGFAAAMNQGIAATQAPYVLWLNPDSELLDNGFEVLLAHMDAHPKTGILGPQILNPDLSVQLSCRSFPSYETALFNRYSLLSRLFPDNPISRKYLKSGWNHQTISETDWVSGACALVRRRMLEEIGLLDEKYFMYCEDVDLCRRAWQAGWKVEYHPGAHVMHHIAGSSRKVKRKMIGEHHRSMWHYYKKHYKRNPLKDLAVGSIILGRCGFKMLASGK